MVPRLFSKSFLSMPMPLSVTVSVRLSLSAWSIILKSLLVMPSVSSVRAMKQSLSIASLALEISSRRKISLCV